MTANEDFSKNELMYNVQLKVKSLITLISEIKQSSLIYEFDPSICNDINEYVQSVQADCRTIMNNIKYNGSSNQTLYCTAQNIYGNTF